MNKLLFALITTCSVALAYGEKTKIEDIKFKRLNSTTGQVEVIFKESTENNPELSIKGHYIEIVIPSSYMAHKIKKRKDDISLVGRNFSEDSTKVTLSLPYSMAKLAHKTSLIVKGKKMILNFPFVKYKKVAVKSKPVADKYDENYLEELLQESKQDVPPLTPPKYQEDEDKVETTFSSIKKENTPFSFTTQIGKFAGLLVLVIGVFYAIILLLKKSVFNKGKLGFLNSTKVMEVLSTSYLAPKRSAILLRVHKQIFLIGSSEKGLHSLGELKDIAGLLKKGEQELSGSNFDSFIESSDKEEEAFNLKEMVDKAQSVDKDKVKFSEQIKNKVKGLKSLQ